MANKTTPLVSIIIPVYNGSRYMREAIDSALNQTYDNIEVIVINDGSSDRGKTDKIAKSYGNRIRYFSKENGGVSSALNYGISKMRGTYFSWLSHDDVYFKNKVKSEIDHLIKKNQLNKPVIPFSDYSLITARGKFITEVKADSEVLKTKPEFALLRGLINGNTLLIPKKAFDVYGNFDESLRCTQDYQKWLEFSKTYKFEHIPKTLVKSRYHKKQVSNTSPLVKKEGNPLWLELIESVNDKTKIRLDGNIYSYYSHLADYLKYSPYDKAYQYCLTKMSNLPKEPITKDTYRIFPSNTAPLSNIKIIKFIQFAQREGIKNVFIRIKNKFSRK